MRIPLVIVICIVVILQMVVEANIKGRVHAEYMRRQWVNSQSGFKILNEPPAGVHAEYRRRWINGQLAVKIPHELPARKHRRPPTPRS